MWSESSLAAFAIAALLLNEIKSRLAFRLVHDQALHNLKARFAKILISPLGYVALRSIKRTGLIRRCIYACVCDQ